MNRTWLIVILAVVVVAVLAAWAAIQPEARVGVITPVTRTIRAYVEEQAVTELPHDHLIATPIAGWLEPIRLREGDTVTADQVVARLEMDDLRDRARQAEQRIAVLETKLAETEDHRLEENALVEIEATVKAIDETVRAAEAKLLAAQATLEFTESELERLRALLESGASNEREIREAELAYRRANAEYQSDHLELAALKTIAAVSYIGPKFIHDYIDRKSFTLEKTRKELAEARAQSEIEKRNLARAEIRSPIDGVVLSRHQTRRQFLQAGTPLLTVGRLDEMEIIAEVLTERAPRIAVDDEVEVFGDGLSDGPLHGRVLRVYPAGFKKSSSLGVEQQRVNVAIRLDQRPEGLGVGYRVHVRIYHDQADNVLTLPRTSLVRHRDGGWQVFVIENGRTALRPVEIGLMNVDLAEIVSGLSASATVLAHPSREITPGMRVATYTE